MHRVRKGRIYMDPDVSEKDMLKADMEQQSLARWAAGKLNPTRLPAE
jgi:hypothetical protein